MYVRIFLTFPYVEVGDAFMGGIWACPMLGIWVWVIVSAFDGSYPLCVGR